LLAAIAALTFAAAGTVRFWQGWLFLLVFSAGEVWLAADIARTSPALLERRLKAGPGAETRPTQRIVMGFAVVLSVLFVVVPGLDRRFAWSDVPPYAVIAGDALVVLGFWISFVVFRANSYGSAVIEVGAEQKVISTGPYRYVRHPMYVGALIMLFGVPFALGSYWDLLVWAGVLVVIVVRLLDEERLLMGNLAGYRAYSDEVRYRLIPGVF
jgi:protein-S-isoprenylcysteine O-methyltransferase Ste14